MHMYLKGTCIAYAILSVFLITVQKESPNTAKGMFGTRKITDAYLPVRLYLTVFELFKKNIKKNMPLL